MWLLPWRKPLVDKATQVRVVAAIKEAESKTTGEVRVYIEHECKYEDPMLRAKEVFAKLHMQKTARRNAVLVYLALNSRHYAIFGDTEIYEKAGGNTFFEKAAEEMKVYLKKNDVAGGLSHCVTELGKALAQHFPYDPSVPKNELPDEIVFGK